MAQPAYDVTVRFCDRYVEKRSRTHDLMVQAARSGVQNIAEGSQASGTSKKTELKLTNVARASLEELRLDYEDFLRQRGLAQWATDDPRRKELVARRCSTADEVARWVEEQCEEDGRHGRDGQHGRNDGAARESGVGGGDQASPPNPAPISSMKSMPSIKSIQAETAANAALVLTEVAGALLDKQPTTLERAFLSEGGFTERLYRMRPETRKRK